MKDYELIAAVKEDVDMCKGTTYTEVSDQRSKAMEYYLGEKFGNEVKGRSQVVTSEVSDTIEWIKPQLLKIFTSTNNLLQFEPDGPGDEKAAKQETSYLNHAFYKDNDGFQILYTWFNDALLQKNGVVKFFWDESEEVRHEDYEGLDQMQYTVLLQDKNIEVVSYTEVPDMQTGMVYYNCRIARKVKKGQIRILPVPPDEFLIYDDYNNLCLDDVPFCCHETQKTRENLLDEGVSKSVVDKLKFGDSEDDIYDKESRFDDIGSSYTSGESSGTNTATVYECYKRVDWNNDGYAELRKITFSGETIISNEEVDYIPFIAITPVPMSHRYYGRSIADLVMDLQLIKSTLLRNILDNLYLINNQRTVIVDGEVNIDDLLDGRIGGVVRANAPGMIEPFPITAFSASAFQMLEYLDNLGENRSGVTKYTQGLDGSSLNKTATGVTKIMNASQERVLLIARVFADGLRRLFLGMHRLLLQNQEYTRNVKLGEEWVPVNPSEWKNRTNMTLNIGLGSADKQAEIANLMNILTMQKEAMAAGADNIVTPQHIFYTITKIIEASGFKDVEGFFADPATAPPPQPKPDINKQMLELQAQIEAKKAQIDEMEAQIKGFSAQVDAQYKQRDLELREMEITGNYIANEQNKELGENRLGLSKYQTDVKAAVDLKKEQIKPNAK
jgi:hypothetical protein